MGSNQSLAIVTAAVVALVLLTLLRWTRRDEETAGPPHIDAQVQHRMQEMDSARHAARPDQTGSHDGGVAAGTGGAPRDAAGAAGPGAASVGGAAAGTLAPPPREPAAPAARETAQERRWPDVQGERLIVGQLTATPMRTARNRRDVRIETLTIPAVAMQRAEKGTKAQGGRVSFYRNATIRKDLDLQWPATGISIWALGDPARGLWPQLQVRLGGALVADFVVDSKQEQEYAFPLWQSIGHTALEVSFVNDAYDARSNEDRNVHVRQIAIQMEREVN